MHPSLRAFVIQYLMVVYATLLPVMFTAFLSAPLILGEQPFEARSAASAADLHMT